MIPSECRAGLTPLDEEIALLLRGMKKPVFLSVNKIDTLKSKPLLADFYQLGQSDIFPISSESGIGVDELLEALLPYLPKMPEEDLPEHPKVAVVGRPNVGKSTLVNATLGEERLVVSEQPGTTRDPVDSLISVNGRYYVLTDTAGMRRRGRQLQHHTRRLSHGLRTAPLRRRHHRQRRSVRRRRKQLRHHP